MRIKGFTLIELLVVIAIIGVLSSFFVSNYMEIRKKSRDAKRMADLREIQKALELYRQSQNPPAYPRSLRACQPLTDASGTVYMQAVPGDPLGNCNNRINYIYDARDLDYVLVACLESVETGDNVKDCGSITLPSRGTGVNCDTHIGSSNSNGKCYVLKP